MLEIKPKKFKTHSLTGRIDHKLTEQSWKNVKRNKGSPGIDGITIKTYHKYIESNLKELMKALKTRGTYKCPPLKRVYIPKGNTKELRPLGIPTVATRCAQEVIRNLIAPIFETQFHENSFGFRPGRNCHQAVERVLEYTKQGYKHVVDIDIKGFFDNIPHEIILTMLRAEIADGNILDIIESFLRSGVVEKGRLIPTSKGVPQGGPISPLLGNVVLNYLDWQLDQKGYRFVRYADDIVILCKHTDEAKSALTLATEILTSMGLELSKEKTKISSLSEGFDFLGFRITSRGVTIRQKSMDKFEDKIKNVTKRSHNLDSKVFQKINQILRGTVNYFHTKFSNVREYFRMIDKWIRRRLRSMKYKVIRHTNNFKLKNKHLTKRGLISGWELCRHKINSWYSPSRGKQVGAAR